MTTCKIDHTAPDMLPVSLCATCNPRGPADLKAIEAQERGEREAARAIERRRYELQKANYRVRAMVRHGEPEPGTVNHTVLGALRKKINRLEQSAT